MSEQKGRVLLRISANLKKTLTEMAEREHRSLNAQIEFLLEKGVREGKAEGDEAPSHRRTYRP
jgi:hypothetical protein